LPHPLPLARMRSARQMMTSLIASVERPRSMPGSGYGVIPGSCALIAHSPAYCLATADPGTPLVELRWPGRCACNIEQSLPAISSATLRPAMPGLASFSALFALLWPGQRPHGRGYPMPARGDALAAARRHLARCRINRTDHAGGED